MIKEAVQTIKSSFGYPDPEVINIAQKWNSLSTLYGRTSTNNRQDRDFFMGAQWTESDLNKKDRIHRVYNYAAQLLRKWQMYEGAKGFDLNVKLTGDDELSIVMAEATEALAYQVIDSAKFFAKYMESRLAKSLYGTIYYAPIWNPENHSGGPRGTLEIRILTPERCRVLYQDNDFDKVEEFITMKRMPLETARRIYGPLTDREIQPDSMIQSDEYHKAVKDYVFGSQTSALYNLDETNTVSIWNACSTTHYKVFVGAQMVINREHGYKINGKGFAPIVPEHNIYLQGYHMGISDLYFITDQLRALNKLYSLLEEVIEDNAYPIMFEINNSLRGQKLKRGEMRGKVIPMTVGANEEGIRQLQASTLVQPILSAIGEVKTTIFDISSMPAAAFGAYQPNTKSGFQATVQMQPALQEVDGRHVRTAAAINDLLRYSVAIIEKEDPQSITIELPETRDPIDGTIIVPAQKIKLTNLSAHQIEVIFGNPLPKDDARVIQNETAKVVNKLESRRTAMQNIGVEAPSKEQKLIDDEDVKLAQVNAKVQAILMQAQADMQAKAQAAAAQQTQGKGTDLGANGPLKPGQNPEQKFPTPKGEGAPVPSTAGEAVAETSIL